MDAQKTGKTIFANPVWTLSFHWFIWGAPGIDVCCIHFDNPRFLYCYFFPSVSEPARNDFDLLLLCFISTESQLMAGYEQIKHQLSRGIRNICTSPPSLFLHTTIHKQIHHTLSHLIKKMKPILQLLLVIKITCINIYNMYK